MSSAKRKVFDLMRDISTMTALASLIFAALLSLVVEGTSMGWQVALALIALAVGIPHGALDHLVSMPRTSISRMTLFILIYIAIAVLAVLAIMSWNVVGFYFVVVMSALHFGIGDTAFLAERDRLNSKPVANRSVQVSYALASGSTPVIIPLVNEKSTSALSMVNPALIDWHRGADLILFQATLSLLAIAIVVQVLAKRNREALDLLLLGLIAIMLPPLVAFALYFGTWHALRHTARLTLNLPSSQRAYESGSAINAIRYAVVPGIPALLGTIIVALAIVIIGDGDISDDYLWTLLVVIWALTVPHMMVTAKLDKRALLRS